MVIVKSCQSLDNLNKLEGEFLLQEEFESKVHAGREESFLLGREALRLALCEQGIEVDLKKIKLKTYDEAYGYPDLTLSLSHTSKCGVAALAKRSDFLALGIDIEREDRPVKDSLIKKLSHPRDLGLRNIEVWILKEAIFKCLSNSHLLGKEALFTDIMIGERNWTHTPSGIKGEWETRNLKPFLMGLATLKNPGPSRPSPDR